MWRREEAKITRRSNNHLDLAIQINRASKATPLEQHNEGSFTRPPLLSHTFPRGLHFPYTTLLSLFGGIVSCGSFAATPTSRCLLLCLCRHATVTPPAFQQQHSPRASPARMTLRSSLFLCQRTDKLTLCAPSRLSGGQSKGRKTAKYNMFLLRPSPPSQ